MMVHTSSSHAHVRIAGDITASEAWQALQKTTNAVLVDVRTQPEWKFVGTPDTSSISRPLICLSWYVYPDMHVNPNFLNELSQRVPDKATPLYFMCRSGGRSLEAATAVANAGYAQCYNILDGFEGNLDPENHRNTTGGWKASQLPWSQT